MIDNKLIKYFKTFTNGEVKLFAKYCSRKFKPKSQVDKVLQYLIKNHKRISNDNLDFDTFHKKISQNLSLKSFQNLLSEVAKILEDYFVWKETEESIIEKKILLLKALQKRGLHKEFNKEVSKLKTILEDSTVGVSRLRSKLEINHLQYFSDNPVKIHDGQKILNTILLSFNEFVEITTLFYRAEMVNRNNWQNESWDQLINEIEVPFSFKKGLPKIMTHLNKIQSGYKKSYRFLKNELLNNVNILDNELKVIILLHLHKYLDKNISDTKLRGTEKLFLFDFALKNELLYSQKKLPLIRFHNIIDTACRLLDFRWAKSFIKDCEAHLPQKDLDETLKLASAQIYFASKQRKTSCDNVIRTLRDIKFSNFRQELRSRTMLLCSYYESKEYYEDIPFITNYVHNYKQFITRRKSELTRREYKALNNLISIIKLLLRKKTPDLGQLIIKVENEKVFFKSWVIARINELQSLKNH